MQLEKRWLKGLLCFLRCNPVLGGDPLLELRSSSRGRRSLMSDVARKACDTGFLNAHTAVANSLQENCANSQPCTA